MGAEAKCLDAEGRVSECQGIVVCPFCNKSDAVVLDKKGVAAGAAIGGASGVAASMGSAATGAAVGSAFCPGPGTVVGGLAGATIGLVGGSVAGAAGGGLLDKAMGTYHCKRCNKNFDRPQAPVSKNRIKEFLTANPICNGIDCIVKNTVMDKCVPREGSVLRVDLGFGFVSHTGVCISADRIVEITEEDGLAKVKSVTIKEFLAGHIRWVRTGKYIYAACANDADKKLVLFAADIAERARRCVGPDRGKYFARFNNCHMFTRYCITGKDEEEKCSWGVADIEQALCNRFKVGGIIWRSTGCTKGSTTLF